MAAFEQTGTGARGVALGDNYASMGDDILSLMYNPASLARVHQKELTTEASKLYTGLSDGSNISQYYFSYGQPIKWGGTMAFGWKQFGLDNLYTERTLSLGYGEWLTQDIAIGGALKQLYHSFGVPNMVVDDNGNIQSGTPSFFAQNGNSNTAYSSDLGFLYKASPRHLLGISIQDVNEPNVALNPADHETVPRTIRMSLAYDADRHLTLAGGIMTQEGLANERDYTWTGSAEKYWTISDGDQVAVRGSLATGSRQFQQGTVGAGYRFTSLQLDYTFVFNMAGITPGNTMGTHRFSLTYRFGPVGVSAKEKAQPKPKPATRSAMPQGYEYTAPTPATKNLPRELEIQITPEDIESGEGAPAPKVPATPSAPAAHPAPLQVQDLDIGIVFDSDYDGVPDDIDQCPGTAPGETVDARGCSASQLDHHGNPLPHQVEMEISPVIEGGN